MTDLPTPLAALIHAAVLLAALTVLQELVRRALQGARAGMSQGGPRLGRWRTRVTGLAPIARFTARYPGISGFIARRFDTGRFTGLPLTLIGIALVYVVLLIAVSRIVLGVHFASDVAAGVLVGGFWAAAAVTIAELVKRRPAEATSGQDEAGHD